MSSKDAPLELWERFLEEGVGSEPHEELVIHYQYLVEAIARKMQRHLPRYVTDEELISSGQVGLLRAMTRYDPEQGVFSRYASTVIWGAIIDGLRAEDFAPSSLRRQQRALEEVEEALSVDGSDHVTNQQIAEELGTSEEEVRELRYKISMAEISPTDPVLMPHQEDVSVAGDAWEKEMCREFVRWLRDFDVRTQDVIIRKYWIGQSLRDISKEMGESVLVTRERHYEVLEQLHPFMLDLCQ